MHDHPPGASAVPGRIHALDAVRGFALFGIVFVHAVEQYLGAPPPASRPNFGIFSPVDSIVRAIDGLLFVGKFFPMFALLFGVSFFIQMDRAARKGIAYERRFLRRLTILFAMGMLHHLVYRGDILAIYAMLGVPLVFFYRASDRTLLWTAFILASGVSRLATFAIHHALGGGPFFDEGDLARNEVYFAALKAGSLPEIFLLNLRDGFVEKLEFQFGVFGRGYQTLTLFLLGLCLARARVHERIDDYRPALRRTVRWSIAIGVAVAVVFAAIMAIAGPPESPLALGAVHVLVGLMLFDSFNLAATAMLLAGFLLVYLRPRPQRVLQYLAPVGRTALTTYVCQSLIGTFFFYGHGFNRLGEVGAAAAVTFGMALFLLQALIANLWLQRFRYGPLEWLWRSLTVGQPQPFLLHPRESTVSAGGAPI